MPQLHTLLRGNYRVVLYTAAFFVVVSVSVHPLD